MASICCVKSMLEQKRKLTPLEEKRERKGVLAAFAKYYLQNPQILKG